MTSKVEFGQWIGNKNVASLDSATIDVENPMDHSVIGVVPAGCAADAEAALTLAKKAQPAWAKKPSSERAKLLKAFAEIIRENSDELSKSLVAEQAKVEGLAAVEIDRKLIYLFIYLFYRDPGADISNMDDDGDDSGGGGRSSGRSLPREMRRRNRAVAEREASRLARPERRAKSSILGHASRSKSAVSSVPMGQLVKKKGDAAEGGGDDAEEEWCGPFSVARQMIAAREEARQKREAEQKEREEGGNGNKEHHPLDGLVEEVELDKKRKANPSMNWRPNNSNLPADGGQQRSNYYAKRRRQIARQRQSSAHGGRVPSLFRMCVDFLVENFDGVDVLGDGVGVDARRAICESLVAKGKMNGAAFDALAETGIEAFELVDCAEVTQDQLSEALQSLIPAGLKALILNHAGRCFGPKAVASIISASPNNCSLFALSIGGAYLLRDSDAASLLAATASTLSSVELKECHLIGNDFCRAIGENFASSGAGNGCLLELSLERMPLSKEGLLTIGSSSDALRNLKSLSVKEVEGVDDDVVSILLGATGGDLESIDLSDNVNLSDDSLSAIRRCNMNGELRALQLGNLKNLTGAGLEALFTYDIPGLPNPPVLRKLDLSSCDEGAVNDDVLGLAAIASSTKENNYGGGNLGSPAKRADLSTLGGLVYVNVSGSSVTDKSMETLAETSASSLQSLDVSFCPKVSDKGLGYLVSNAGTQFAKLHIWGCAQITDEFLDGHDRVEEGGLEIIGVWMKQSGRRSVR